MTDLTQEVFNRWVDRHDERHKELISRELYYAHRSDLKEELQRLNRLVSRLLWTLLSFGVALTVDVITRLIP